ncbi:DUF4097 family beta strand repeat-containing protein [Kitasatospora sp. LaBMicrA B282]|uniref:DUF4097 family beta strand repeat-containing protein n=1 Tax=Kitasatospora sp. LaBMicrA B282 TaxID=3420949 RepID=UPI003D1273FD
MNQRLAKLLGCTAITGIVAFGATGCFWDADQHKEVSYGISQPVKKLVVKGDTGAVDVVGGGDAVTVTEHQTYKDGQPATTHRVSADGTLTLTYDCRNCGVGYDVHVPAGTVVELTEDTGDIELSGLTADVQADVDTGQIRATGLGADKARLHTGTGSVTAAFTARPTAVDAHTETGSISITVPQGVGYAVSAGAQTGSVDVSVPQDGSTGRTINAHTETGSVSVANG